MMIYNGRYRGLVIQNNDPKHAGRVKVYLPGINLLQIDNWNQRKEEDKFFTVLGQNTKTSITKDILQNQKEKLFWAETSMPLFGMSSPGFYHAPSDVFYIGNDSDYLGQQSNKSLDFFSLDRQTQIERDQISYQPSDDYIQPRTQIDITFNNLGQKYCFNGSCDSNGALPSIWQNNYKNDCLNNITKNLSSGFNNTPLSSIQVPTKNPNINDSIINIEIDVINPDIYVNDVFILKNNPVYNNSCVNPEEQSDIFFSPPIKYKESNDIVSTPNFNNIPVKVLINGKDTINKNFKLSKNNEKSLEYTSDTVRVIIPKKNIKSINVNKNKNSFDLNKILGLIPIIQSTLSIIMPRSPVSQGETMYSRGGGGGEIYNTVTTDLLTQEQRRNAHVGGANNESKYTVNYGRTSLNDPNNTKGNNIQSSKLQLHRGPMRSPDYNNDWKGLISIPGVGAHVWVEFENSDPLYPIIVGTFAAKSDYEGIFEI